MSEGINLKDTTKYKLGSVEYQEAMIHNIGEKLKYHEEMGPAEKVFLKVQKEHNKRLILCQEIGNFVKEEQKGIEDYNKLLPELKDNSETVEKIIKDEKSHVDMLQDLSKKLGCD